MNKDKKWLKEKADRLFFDNSMSNNPYLVAKREAITEISNLIDQLDEPEVPVIPQFVADLVESYRETPLVELLHDVDYVSTEEIENFRRWFHDKMGFESSYSEFLARAWLDGYEVEKERKYYVLTRSNKLLLTKDDGVVRGTYQAYSWVTERDKEHYQLTEQEIKDYDERFWAFAEEVTE